MQGQVSKGENPEKKPVFFRLLSTKISKKPDERKLAVIVGAQNTKSD
jgi:hypothetical protein